MRRGLFRHVRQAAIQDARSLVDHGRSLPMVLAFAVDDGERRAVRAAYEEQYAHAVLSRSERLVADEEEPE